MRLIEKTRKELSTVEPLPTGQEEARTMGFFCETAYSGRGKTKTADKPLFPGAHAFGQDCVWNERVMTEDLTANIMMICDGHGQNGDKASQNVLVAFRDKIKTGGFLNRLGSMIETQDTDLIRTTLTDLFLEVEQGFEGQGGTTVSLAIVISFCHGGNYLVTANVGDSPIFLIPPNKDKTYLAFKSHSWDDIEERKEYLSYCAENSLEPREVILGRFNTPAGPTIARENGSKDPWFLFRPGTAEVDHESLQEFHRVLEKKHKGSIGGVQSARKMIVSRDSCSIDPHPLYYHENWGSTAFDGFVGRTQMTRSIGDLESKEDLHMRAHPSVKIHSFSESGTFHLLLTSDGFSDLFYYHEFHEILLNRTNETSSARDKIKIFFGEMLKRGLKEFGFDSTGHPLWDDCSFCLAVFKL